MCEKFGMKYGLWCGQKSVC